MSDTSSTLYEQPSLLLQQQFNPVTDLRRRKPCWLRDSFARIRRQPWMALPPPPPPLPPPPRMTMPMFYSPPRPHYFYYAGPMGYPRRPWPVPVIVMQACCCDEAVHLHRPGSEKEQCE